MSNKLNLIGAITQALENELSEDKTVVVYGEDVGVEGGVFRATQGLQEKFGEARVFDAPLAESGIVGTAIGMAINGLKPVVEMQFMGFSYPAFNQIVTHVSRMRNRSRGRYTLPMVIRMPYGGGIRALEHHSESTEAMYAQIPGLKVVIPSTPYDAKGLLIAAIRDPDPVVFLEPKRIYRAFRQDVPEESYELPIGKAKIVQEGSDVTININYKDIPLIKNSLEYARMGLVPAGSYANKTHIGDKVSFKGDIPEDMKDVLYDPQTSGGLMISVSKEDSEKVLDKLKTSNLPYGIIGEVKKYEENFINVK